VDAGSQRACAFRERLVLPARDVAVIERRAYRDGLVIYRLSDLETPLEGLFLRGCCAEDLHR
jgi:hypothetical protein